MDKKVSVIDNLEALECAAQGNDRLNTLTRIDNPDLRQILFLALSPDITFGIKKIPEPTMYTCWSFVKRLNDEEWYLGICALLSDLQWRRLTGNAAIKSVADFLASCSDLQKKWTERIIRQDLRLNLGAKDVNNALGKDTIYLFAVPLATDYKKVKEKDLKGSWYVQPKMDGGRCTAILYPDGNVALKSRTGKEWGNFESIRSILVEINKSLNSNVPIYVDGEVVSWLNGKIDFQAIQKTMMRKDGKEVGELHFVMFDMATEEEWKNPKAPYRDRLNGLLKFSYYARQLGFNNKIYPILWKPIANPTFEELEKISKEFVEAGFEGAVARRSDIPVQNKRSKILLKVKSFIDDEAEVIGAAELQQEGKGAGILGAIKCRLKSGVEFEIGSGFSAEERESLWKSIDKHIGQFVNFKMFELTNDGVPRFPVFRYFRFIDDFENEGNL